MSEIDAKILIIFTDPKTSILNGIYCAGASHSECAMQMATSFAIKFFSSMDNASKRKTLTYGGSHGLRTPNEAFFH